jgi:hypothetical protein
VREISKRIQCYVYAIKLSRKGILMHLYRLDQIVLASFFGNAEIPLEGNIEALGPK